MVVDQQEGHPWTFQGFLADKKQGGGRLVVPRRRAHLKTGDYSIEGCEEKVTVERKSMDDLVQTLAGGRARFAREHERMAAMGRGNAVVMVEGSWRDIFEEKRESRMHPKTIHRTALSWFQRYGVAWWFFGSRRLAEESCLRFLQLWYRHESEERDKPVLAGPPGRD